jgi:hypothetical protein
MPEQEIAQIKMIDKIIAEGAITQVFIGASGAFGGMLAALADLIQKEQASAVLKINEILRTTLQIPTRPIAIVALLVAFGIALCFVFGADSNKKAFYTGASILSIMMALVPYKIPPSISVSPNQSPSGTLQDDSWLERYVMPGVVFAQSTQPSQSRSIHVHLFSSDRKPITTAVYTLVDPESLRVIARSKIQGPDFSFSVSRSDYLIRVEVPGYNITERSLNGVEQDLAIPLVESRVPLFVQRAISRP